jgi:hypothetical protein
MVESSMALSMHTHCARDENQRELSATPATRWIGILTSIPATAVLIIAMLDIQVSQPYCGVKTRTGYPCPTCGMTTSFRALGRGEIGDAFAAHPFGPGLFAVTVLVAVTGAIQAVAAKPVFAALGMRWWWWLLPVGGILAGWAVKIIVGLQTGRYPLH